MKIVSFEAENIKCLKVVNIKPNGSVVVVGGDNEAGKSCVLDSIEYALNGAGSVPPEPIRKGQKKARIVIDMGDIQVTRTFTKKGTNLVVKNKDGTTFASPQSVLAKLTGDLDFDPLEFSKMDDKRQAEILKKLAGLDFNVVNIEYRKLFEHRTNINRQGKELKAQLECVTKHEGVPDKEVSVKKLSDQYTKAITHNNNLANSKEELKDEVSELKRLKERVSILTASIKEKKISLSGIKEVDSKAVYSKMSEAEHVNLKVRENDRYTEIDTKLKELRKQSFALGSKMTEIANKKEADLEKAKFPIKGLAIDEDGVTFDSIPLIQCSTAQQIKISVAIGLAMNPKLRILLIREGSLLDESNLAMIAKMADKADAQVWLERVSKGSECSVIIEDGSVQE